MQWKFKWTTLAILATLNVALASDYGSHSPVTVSSPDGRLQAVFSTDDGGMRWSLLRDGKTLVKPSAMGFKFAVGNNCDKDAAEFSAMRVVGVRRSSADTAWET